MHSSAGADVASFLPGTPLAESDINQLLSLIINTFYRFA